MRWRKSSYSGAESNCVEVNGTLDAVRDSKNPSGPLLRASVPGVVRAIRAGQLHR
jgi:hypothetical protein